MGWLYTWHLGIGLVPVIKKPCEVLWRSKYYFPTPFYTVVLLINQGRHMWRLVRNYINNCVKSNLSALLLYIPQWREWWKYGDHLIREVHLAHLVMSSEYSLKDFVNTIVADALAFLSPGHHTMAADALAPLSPGHQQPWFWLCRINRSLLPLENFLLTRAIGPLELLSLLCLPIFLWVASLPLGQSYDCPREDSNPPLW